MARNEAVAVDHGMLHAEVVAAMPDQLIDLFERAFIEQQLDAFASRELSFPMLARFALAAAALLCARVPAAKLF
jgi:uncharacterized membrane protein YebE (DUF533 family)